MTAKLRRRTLASARAPDKVSGRAKLPRKRGKATVTATFRSGGAVQTARASAALRRG